MKSTLLLMSLLCIPAFADTATKTALAEADNEVVEHKTCKKEKDERVLEVIPQDKGCVLHYTKDGKTELKAKATHGVQICQSALKKISERLETAGYQCQ